MGLERQLPSLLGSQLSVPVALAVVEVTSTSAWNLAVAVSWWTLARCWLWRRGGNVDGIRYKTYFWLCGNLTLMRGAGLVHISLSKYVYLYIFILHTYIHPPKQAAKDEKKTNPNRWWFVPLISQKLGSLTWVCTTFEVRGVTYSANIDLHMKWTKQDPWEICAMNI